MDVRARGGTEFADASAGTKFEARLMAEALAGLFAAGAALAFVTAMLPDSHRTSRLGMLVIILDAAVIAALLHWKAARVPRWTLPVALAWGTAHITGVVYFSGESPSPLIFFYLWIFLYSAYFFTRVENVIQILCVGILYEAVLIAHTPPTGVAPWWLVGMGSMLVSTVLIGSMRSRVERLIGQLYDTARILDPLTKLINRRGFRELLDLELERARRSKLQVAVLLGDVDYFKEVNDRSGHAVGDRALERLAGVIERAKRTVDVAARVGGEEIALILPDTDEGGAFVLAERLRCAIQEEFAEDTVPITISFGIATYPDHAETAGAVLRSGDEALYAAKENGRNRSVIYSPELRTGLGEQRGKRDIRGERYVAILLELAEALDLRFSGSARHTETVGRYAEIMARELGLPETRVHRVKLAGILHDIGKVGVPEQIPRQAGSADRRGVGDHAPPPRARRADARTPGPQRSARVGRRPPRAPRRQGLPARDLRR